MSFQITNLQTDTVNMMDYHASLNSKNVVLYYKGPFDEHILSNISSQLRRKFSDNPRAGAKLFAIFIELAQNISYYSAESNFFYDEEGQKNGVGTVVIIDREDAIVFSAGNLVKSAQVVEIIAKCQEINTLSFEELRALKRDTRSTERTEGQKGGNIGLIHVALKSENPLEVEAKVVDEHHSFFMISATIQK
jgi:hypothetical protein